MITIMKKEDIRRTINSLASKAIEANNGTDDLVIVGIRKRGVILARRLQEAIARQEGILLPLGVLDIVLQRDDLLTDQFTSVYHGSEIDFEIEGKNVIVCDDVMYTGRTARAALSALHDLGRAKTVRLYTLIDRGHRELPFRPDATGKDVPTSSTEKVVTAFEETDGFEGVFLLKADEEMDVESVKEN